jgi:Uma2 family endonuclease
MNDVAKYRDDGLSLARELPLRRFSIKEYYALGKAGILGEDDGVELLDGLLVMMARISPPRAYVIGKLHDLLERSSQDRFHVRTRQPVRLPTSEPQPDLSVVVGTPADFRSRHPSPRDVLLLVDVVDMMTNESRIKAQLYATAKVREYWVLDIARCHVQVQKCGPKRPKALSPTHSVTKGFVKQTDRLHVNLLDFTAIIAVHDLLPVRNH